MELVKNISDTFCHSTGLQHKDWKDSMQLLKHHVRTVIVSGSFRVYFPSKTRNLRTAKEAQIGPSLILLMVIVVFVERNASITFYLILFCSASNIFLNDSAILAAFQITSRHSLIPFLSNLWSSGKVNLITSKSRRKTGCFL